ncbi:isoaspartyl peptidase/L-asparaginase family protein [Deinococcus peraridilitoris]|uniref:Asparaginase n=1 Tax=Deinococcus peraridilitoris (strain DSM 19664 / LMG 22246 / CIP 109416 / KR-200) TaxID=937777 RepID=L0A0X2_DEIPD|nr:isoaspartyl peptidase/L-asparaginase family protein [Deinococcus peraridilitoris]AFZ66832.1 asparaginase [Deinococcus peraridilitoris DSM 19664]
MPDRINEAGGHWAIIVHGGAHEVPPEKASASRAGCLAAQQAGRKVLEGGGSAVEAVEAALRLLEDDPTFNAGFGSAPNSVGEVEMDSGLMDGRTLDVGAVAGLRGVRHPASVARALLRETPVMLIGDAARQFAREQGAELCEVEALISPAQREAYEEHDTVGCVALDAQGNLAAGTSTGGLSGQRPGRVGDSPLPGCGFYADNELGAVALTGEGESIARMMVAARILHLLARPSPEATSPDGALQEALQTMQQRVGGEAGAIVITPDGQVGWWHNSPNMPVAYQTSRMAQAGVFLSKTEEQDVQ